MLFTTAAFICVFLPVTLIGFFAIARFSHARAALWLFVASVFFYGYWMPVFTLLLLASITGNFWVGTRIASLANADDDRKRAQATRWMVFGVAANLTLLGYFKYANFFVDNFNAAVGSSWDIGRVILPIGISFFTFTQIAFLADAWRKGIREYRFVHYGLFVSYFPHLIAGPVLHHAQMMPQFRDAATYRFNSGNFSAGLAIFALGMFKKVVLADGISPYADAIFKARRPGHVAEILRARGWALWRIPCSSTLIFPAIRTWPSACRWMLNVRLPFNFNSPYQAANISDFWRRWHMSLSQFLRDYLYIAPGRQPQRGCQALCEPDGHDGVGRFVARSRLVFCALGHAARPLSGGKPWLSCAVWPGLVRAARSQPPVWRVVMAADHAGGHPGLGRVSRRDLARLRAGYWSAWFTLRTPATYTPCCGMPA